MTKGTQAKGASGPDRWIFWLAVGLLGFGAVFVFSASAHLAGQNYDAPVFFFAKQLVFLLLGIGILLVGSRVPYTFWLRHYRWLLLAGFLVLLAVLFMPSVRGARRWISLGPLNLQASEVFRFAVIVFMAAVLSRRRRGEVEFKKRTLPHLLILGFGSALIMLQPDLGAVLLLGGTVIALLFLADVPVRQLFGITVPAVLLCVLVVLGLGYKRERLANYAEGLQDPLQASYQVRQAAAHMGAGGLWGVGLGGGTAKFYWVPDAHTDFILASIGEELGLIATVMIVTAYGILLARCLRTAGRAPDRFAALLAGGFAVSLGLQTFLNLGVVLGLLPPTGLPLPLLSYGGSSVLFVTSALAVILNISRHVRG